MTSAGRRARRAGIVVTLLSATLLLVGCSGGGAEESAEEGYHPSVVEAVADLDVKRVTLTENAALRIGLETAVAAEEGEHTVVPYSALIYDGLGAPWVYLSEEPLTFLRHAIVVDRIEGDSALISEGLRPGDRVATVGATQVYGAELGIDGGH